MKFIFSVALCFLLGWNVVGQIAADVKIPVGISEISLAKGDGKGGIGETAEKFTTTDAPIYFIIQLDSFAPVTVRMNLIAVKAVGLPPETKSVNVSYTTDGNQSQVNFNASPSGAWAAGSYRADFYLDGKLAESRRFEIENSIGETAPKKSPPAKAFVSRGKKIRKN